MEKLKLKVYAKVNLALDILGKFENGYHDLDMLMASVNIFDTMTFNKAKSNQVKMDGKVVGAENTAVKALELLSGKYGIHMNVQITKGIPFAAGMGGSSADASGVFVAASKLYDIPLKELEELAAKVGSDVIYMMYGGFARVRGQGENIEKIDLPMMDILIAQLEPGGSTKDVYAEYDKNPTKTRLTIDQALEQIKKTGRGFFNVLSDGAIKLCPSIEYSLKDIYAFTDRVFMTGSGSAVVGIFDRERDAKWCEINLVGYLVAKTLHTMPEGIEVREEY